MNSISRRWAFLLAAAALIAALSGCEGKKGGTRYYTANGNGDGKIRVVVLPFDNVSREQDAGKIMTNTAITYLLSTGLFDVVEPGLVDKAAADARLRLTSTLDSDSMQTLGQKLNIDAIILGTVEEYSEVRVGADSYPSVSVSARLVNPQTGSIVWAGTVSRTGADSVKIFDIGRVSSTAKLSRMVIESMAKSMLANRGSIIKALHTTQAPANPNPTTVVPVGQNTGAAPVNPPEKTEKPASASGGSARYMDESKTYVNGDFKALLVDIAGYTRGEINYQKFYHAIAEADYAIGSGPQFVHVKLVDYLKPAIAEKFVAHYNPGGTAGKFQDLTCYRRESSEGYAHLDIALGRFGLYLACGKSKKDELDKFAGAFVKAMQ